MPNPKRISDENINFFIIFDTEPFINCRINPKLGTPKLLKLLICLFHPFGLSGYKTILLA